MVFARAHTTVATLVGQGLLDRDALDFIERDFIAHAIIELGGARAFVRGHGLGVLERTADFETGGDAGRPEHMAASLILYPASAVRRRII
jgi:hypothetical protein